MKNMKKLTAALAVVIYMSVPTIAFAAPAVCATSNSAQGQVLSGVGQTGTDCTGDSVTNVVAAVVQILSIVVGVAAVLVIIISGLKYVTSAGDSNKISSAKNTLVYALIGLAVAAFAQVLVRYVIGIVK